MVGHMLLGALLVVVGILAAALADRIRNIRASSPAREVKPARAEPQPTAAQAEVVRRSHRVPPLGDTEAGREMVIKMLTHAGFKARDAAAAVDAAAKASAGAPLSQEQWVRAALQQARKGAAS